MTQARSRRQLESKEGWVKAGARVSTQQSSEGIISHTGEAPCWWPGNLQRRSFSPRFHRPLRCLQTPGRLLKSANVQLRQPQQPLADRRRQRRVVGLGGGQRLLERLAG